MDVFKERCTHLINMINTLITEVENDYFIPQMLNHTKSAEFIPERMTELFQELLDEEHQQFSEEMSSSIQELYNEVKSNKKILDQDRFSNSRTINRAKLQNKSMKMEFDSGNQKLQSLKQIGKTILDEYDLKIRKMETSISNIRKNSSKLRNNIQKLQSFCLSERNLYEENFNSQIFDLKQALKKAVKQINYYATDYQIVQSVSKPKLKKLIKQYKYQNDILNNSMDQMIQLFNGNLSDSESDIQAQISKCIQHIHKPLFIKDKRIRSDNIQHSIENYIREMDDKIQEELIKIQEREYELTQKIESFHTKKNISSRNLRAIYASRQKQRFPIPNSDELNLRYD